MHRPPSPALVLVADDNPLNLEVICGVLTSEGLEVAVAGDGDEVLDAVCHEEPDLILLDALMPRLDGFETCKRLKANPATSNIPVMFMTSLTETRHRIHGFSVGAVDYVTRPFEREELLARVRTQIALRGSARALEEKNARLLEEIAAREAVERALGEAAQKLERRTEELCEANEKLERELRERAHTEAARGKLQEQIISAQRERLLELAAPLIPITSGILVMPLVGTMDAERAAQAVEAALRGASELRARSLIIDITGIKTVDVTVATMLVQAARGLALLGTRAVITGIRPEVAQTLVRLDLRLDTLVTKSNLQAGVVYALGDRGARSQDA